MGFFTKQAAAARKALRMDNSGLFFLLTMMTALLGVLLSFMGAGLAGSMHVYQSWQLNQQQSLMLTLLGDTPQSDKTRLEQALQQDNRVERVTLMPENDVKALLTPFVPEGSLAAVPLPQVYVLELKPQSTPEKTDAAVLALEDVILTEIPTAMLDDNRALLARVGHFVQLLQTVVMTVILLVLAVMVGLVMLTVQAGIRTQRASVAVLKFLGGTDGFVTRLVVHQVLQRAVAGWLYSAGCFVMFFMVAGLIWPVLQPWWHVPLVWACGLGAGVLLVLLTFVVAYFTAQRSLVAHG